MTDIATMSLSVRSTTGSPHPDSSRRALSSSPHSDGNISAYSTPPTHPEPPERRPADYTALPPAPLPPTQNIHSGYSAHSHPRSAPFRNERSMPSAGYSQSVVDDDRYTGGRHSPQNSPRVPPTQLMQTRRPPYYSPYQPPAVAPLSAGHELSEDCHMEDREVYRDSRSRGPSEGNRFPDDPHTQLESIIQNSWGMSQSLNLTIPRCQQLCDCHRAVMDQVVQLEQICANHTHDLQSKERELERTRKAMDQRGLMHTAETNRLKLKIQELEPEIKRLGETIQSMEKDRAEFEKQVNEERNALEEEFEKFKNDIHEAHEAEKKSMEENHAAEKKGTEEAHADKVKNLEKTHEVKVNTMNEAHAAKLKEMEESFAAEKNKMKEVQADKVTNMEETYKKEKKDIQDTYEAEMRAMNEKFANERKSLKESFATEKQTMEGEFASKKQAMEKEFASQKHSMEDDFASQKQAMENEFASQKQSMENYFASENQTIQERHSVVKQGLEEAHATKIAHMAGAHATQIAQMEKSFAAEKAELHEIFEKQKAELNDDFEAAKAAWGEEKKQITTQFTDEKNRLEDLNRGLKVDNEQLEDIKADLECNVATLEDKVARLEEDNAGLEGDKSSLIDAEAKLSSEKYKLEDTVKTLELDHQNLQKENLRLLEIIKKFGEEEEGGEIKSRGDGFYIDAFTKLTKDIVDISNQSSDLPIDLPQRVLAKLPPNMPSMLGDYDTSRFLRQGYIQHTISKYICDRIFQPFLFSPGKHYDTADAFLQAMSNKLREKSTRKEAVWRHYTLLAGYTASNAKKNAQDAAASVIEEITGSIKPFVDERKMEVITSGITRIVKFAIETWRYARMEREIITATMSYDDMEASSWSRHQYEKSLPYSIDSALTTTLNSKSAHRQTPIITLLPVFSREGTIPSLHRPNATPDNGLIFSKGVALFNNCLPVLHREHELESIRVSIASLYNDTAIPNEPYEILRIVKEEAARRAKYQADLLAQEKAKKARERAELEAEEAKKERVAREIGEEEDAIAKAEEEARLFAERKAEQECIAREAAEAGADAIKAELELISRELAEEERFAAKATAKAEEASQTILDSDFAKDVKEEESKKEEDGGVLVTEDDGEGVPIREVAVNCGKSEEGLKRGIKKSTKIEETPVEEMAIGETTVQVEAPASEKPMEEPKSITKPEKVKHNDDTHEKKDLEQPEKKDAKSKKNTDKNKNIKGSKGRK